jgi:hypothetical protein
LVRCLSEDVDLAAADAQVSREDAVALLSEVARSDAFTSPTHGTIDAQGREQTIPQILQHGFVATHCEAGAALIA